MLYMNVLVISKMVKSAFDQGHLPKVKHYINPIGLLRATKHAPDPPYCQV